MRLFDTHAHLTDKRFDKDRQQIIAGFGENGIELVMDVAEDVENARACIKNAEQHAMIYAAAGVHPHQAQKMKTGYIDELARLLEHDKVKAVGEIGLDYHHNFSPREVQKKVFYEQLELAASKKLPVILHDREAHADMLDALRTFRGKLTGVMHCFSGSYETAVECIRLGYYISFAGPLTFINAVKLQDAAARLPSERLLIETDCPYLAPEPVRGKRNEPKNVAHTVTKMAELRGVEPEEMALITFENGQKLFRI
ncbi:MAG: TatD family hydrolase [Christensenellales bacterium]|jgi:TatD DNase family protein